MFASPVMLLTVLPAAAAPTVAAYAQADNRLPDGVRAMIDAAIAGGDGKTIESMLSIARQTHAYAGAEIDEIAQQWKLRIAAADAEKKAQAQAAAAAPPPDIRFILPGWKGEVEFGASRSTGRTSYVGVLGSVGLEREGESWRQKLQARIELQNGRNVADVERVTASWQPNYKFRDELYAFGLAQYERDELQGFEGRYTAGAGVGYSVFRSPKATLELESGPAFRYVDQVGGTGASSVAGRASFNFRWAIAPTLELKQTSALYVEQGDRNASALTALDAQLIGPLKVRLSYDVRYEAGLPAGQSALDTLSRATLVYRF